MPRLSWLSRLLGQSEVEEMKLLTKALATAIAELPERDETRWYRSHSVEVTGRHTLTAET